jgi:hypothetical protein
MAGHSTCVVTIYVRRRNGQLTARAVPDPAVIFAGDKIRWEIRAASGITDVRVGHFRLQEKKVNRGPFKETARSLKSVKTSYGGEQITATVKTKGFVATYKYAILVRNEVVVDPEVQIKER